MTSFAHKTYWRRVQRITATTTRAVMATFAPQLAPQALTAAKPAAPIMATNNIYYRFTDLASAPDYKTLPARLRMNVMASLQWTRRTSNSGTWRWR